VRLFQRKYKWFNRESLRYDKISSDLTPNLEELLGDSFLRDENSITSYEEIIDLLKLPQLKELAKACHVVNFSQTVKNRSEYIRLILQHFRTQKSLNFLSKVGSPSKETQMDSSKSYFLLQCKKILGRVVKLNNEQRNVFVRILMLFSLTSTFHISPEKKNDNAQHNL